MIVDLLMHNFSVYSRRNFRSHWRRVWTLKRVLKVLERAGIGPDITHLEAIKVVVSHLSMAIYQKLFKELPSTWARYNRM